MPYDANKLQHWQKWLLLMAWMFSDNDRTKADVDHPVAGIFWHPTYLHCSQVENGDIESFETYTLYLHSTPINWSHMTSKMSPPFWWQFLDGIASPSTYPVSQFSQHLPCQSVSGWVIDSFRLEIAIASPTFASLLHWTTGVKRRQCFGAPITKEVGEMYPTCVSSKLGEFILTL